MSKNNTILIVNESDFEINSKLDTIIDLVKSNQTTATIPMVASASTSISTFNIDTSLKLDAIIELINSMKFMEKQISNQSAEISELKIQLATKDKKIERLEQIKSDFKLNPPSDSDNKLKYNQLIRKKITFPFNSLLSYDLILNHKLN